MKLDSKEKYERIRKFVGEIKSNSNIEPFLMTQEIAKYGIYDFCYINKNPGAFSKIDKKLKQSKYDELEEFVQQLRQVFIVVADYALQTDPIQQLVQSFQSDIKIFASKFKEDFSPVQTPHYVPPMMPQREKIRMKEPIDIPIVCQLMPPPQPPSLNRPTNLPQKLQMLFLLRANQNNEPYIRSIGSAYRIGEEIDDEYVISLDNKNTSWMQFISKND